MSRWTFGQRLGAAFALVITLALLIAAVSWSALGQVVAAKDRVVAVQASSLLLAQQLDVALARDVASVQGFLLLEDPSFLEDRDAARTRFAEAIATMREDRELLADVEPLVPIEQAAARVDAALDALVASRRAGATPEALGLEYRDRVEPQRRSLDDEIRTFVAAQEALAERERAESSAVAERARWIVLAIAIVAALVGSTVAVYLTRALTSGLGLMIRQLESSATELQAASTEQATSTSEQAASMTEISTTMQELLTTSRQIADSSRRVVEVAADTADAARSGDDVAVRASETTTEMKRQVDLIVSHILDLGKRSQQIGAVLEIINELAEQTNILAINATIEAAGAGESGRRFAAVADEIRKLADRTTGSTKEIRGLIEEIRSSVHTTVMTTESGSKAVDLGTRQFGEVAGQLRAIGALVTSTNDAAREIELSTNQQTTAVEQVNIAIGDIAKATRLSEASSSQIVQTASILTGLARDLARVIRPETSR